jgi:hypothetical protein
MRTLQNPTATTLPLLLQRPGPQAPRCIVPWDPQYRPRQRQRKRTSRRIQHRKRRQKWKREVAWAHKRANYFNNETNTKIKKYKQTITLQYGFCADLDKPT